MPTYDYRCNACQKTIEIFHSMSEPARKKCPLCGKNALERQLGTGGAIIFKGSGFYQTDYRSESYKNAQKADTAPAASSSDAKSSAAPGSAPAAAPASTPAPAAASSPAKTEPSATPKPKKKPSKSSD
jgi:putative FmdB family regulatory protein